MIKDRSDFAAGLVFVAVGLVYGRLSLDMALGTALRMGPGFFPFILCGLLVLLGLAIIGKSLLTQADGSLGTVPWRALTMIPLAIVFFGIFIMRLGLFPTVFATAFIGSLSSSQVSLKIALAVSLALAIFCTLIFAYGVTLPIPVLGNWLVN